MRIIVIIFFFTLYFMKLEASENFKFYLKKAINNNLELNAERKNLELAKQDRKISRSEFLPSITISGDQTSTTSTNRTNQSGASLADSNSDTENKNISLEQVIFSGFKGVNTFKKSELETQKATLKLRQKEQQIIFETAFVYFDYIFKSNNEKFNFSNVNLFERQVEFDNARLQKGEITLTDLAQSESSLAGANAKLIKAQTELLVSTTNFERITREKAPTMENLKQDSVLDLPNSLKKALEQSNLNNTN